MNHDPAADDRERAAVAGQPALLFFASLVLLQLTAAAALQLANVGFGLIFSEVFFFACPAVLWCLATGFSPRAFLRLGRVSPALLGLGAAIGAANFLVAGAVQVLTRAVLPEALRRQVDLTRLFELQGADLAAVVAAVTLFAPLGEEIAFRGYLQTVYRARLSDRAAIALTAVLFAALHLEPVGFFARIELGVVFGLLVLWSGSLWPAMAAHAVNNGLVTVLFLASGKPAAPEAEPTLGMTLTAGAAAAAATWALARFFRDRAASMPARSTPLRRSAPETSEGSYAHGFDARRIARPLAWMAIVAVLSVAAFLALGWRGVALNYAELAGPDAELKDKLEDGSWDELRKRLEQARRAAREGDVPIGRYRDLRRELGQSAREGGGLSAAEVESAFRRFDRAPGLP